MFTGIVEEIGYVKTIKKGSKSMQLKLTAKKILEDIQLGDSISINGVCLTVISYNPKEFVVDVMPETFHSTTTTQLKTGSPVNLERAIAPGGRFGGHIVSGHVDAVGTILKKRPVGNAVYIDLAIPEVVARYCIPKGSITVDGTSLTIFDITDKTLTISLIPHTNQETILGQKKEGETVNLECDVLGKYVIHQLLKQNGSTITQNFLQQNGF